MSQCLHMAHTLLAWHYWHPLTLFVQTVTLPGPGEGDHCCSPLSHPLTLATDTGCARGWGGCGVNINIEQMAIWWCSGINIYVQHTDTHITFAHHYKYFLFSRQWEQLGAEWSRAVTTFSQARKNAALLLVTHRTEYCPCLEGRVWSVTLVVSGRGHNGMGCHNVVISRCFEYQGRELCFTVKLNTRVEESQVPLITNNPHHNNKYCCYFRQRHHTWAYWRVKSWLSN